MTLPAAPDRWDIKRVTAERVEAVAARGFTERQARFLVTVMLHAGVFVERQYCAFAGIIHGQKTHDFLNKLSARGYATTMAVGSAHRGRIVHVHHKGLYAAIGQTDNRNRKRMPVGRMIERLMLLDAVLDDATFTWLGAEHDKRMYFMRAFREQADVATFPHVKFGAAANTRIRYFTDKMPIGVEPSGIDHVFVYLVTQPDPMDFRIFLLRHADLLRWLCRWRVRVLFPQPFASAIRLFGHAAREQLATRLDHRYEDQLKAYFRVRRDAHVSANDAHPASDGLAPLVRMTRIRALYKAWLLHGDTVLWNSCSPVLPDAIDRGSGGFEFVPLKRQYLHLSHLVGVA